MYAEKDIVLITGANSGIGYETAKLLVAHSPHYHILVASRTAQKAQQAISSIESSCSIRGTLEPVHLDITDHATISRAVENVAKDHGRLDVLINNAGISGSPDLSLVEQFRTCYETNVIGTMATTEAFRPLLRHSNNPRLIFLSSSLSSISMRLDPQHVSYNLPGHAYRASKAALNMWAACASWEMRDVHGDGKGGAPVWIVDPGLVVTNLTGNPEALRQRGAGSPVVSAETILGILEGKRDADVGKLLHKDGTYPF